MRQHIEVPSLRIAVDYMLHAVLGPPTPVKHDTDNPLQQSYLYLPGDLEL